MHATALDTRSAWHAPSRIGYDATPEQTVARVLPMLADERVVWLSTVRPDGTPHLCPTWFWWDGSALVVFSKPDAVKARNLHANPRLMVAVGDAEADFSVGLIEAEAVFEASAADVPDAFFAKYADELVGGRLDAAAFRATYTLAIRIVPTRFLAWHGRGARHDRVPATRGRRRAAGLAVRVAGTLERMSARLRLAAVGPIASAAG